MEKKKTTTYSCKQKHVVDVVGKVLFSTRGHMELSQDNALTAQKDFGVDIYNCIGHKLSQRSPKEAKKNLFHHKPNSKDKRRVVNN